MLLFVKSAITGERQFAANFIIFGQIPCNPVALEVSSEFMTENTCSVVMQGILKYVLSGTLLLTYSVSFVRSNWFVPVLFQFKIGAIDEKYSFNLDAIVLESKMCSLFIISSSGMLLALVVEPLFTALKCFQMLLVFFEDST